jgi:hypothetical protein
LIKIKNNSNDKLIQNKQKSTFVVSNVVETGGKEEKNGWPFTWEELDQG